jgi:hypothetical protein
VKEGCSYTFGVGFLRTYDPQQIRAKLAEVRMAIAHDRYLKDIPSIKKSVVAFHAKGEMRYFEYLREKIELVWDIYDLEKLKIKGQTIYDRRKNPFHVEKISEIKKPAPPS